MLEDNTVFDKRALEIEKEFSYEGYKVVRREMFAHLREPAMTIRYDSITFNRACIEGFEDVVYIQIMVDSKKHRIAIRKCNENDKDALRWCIAKTDKRTSRVLKGTFSKKIFAMMDWMQGCRYKIMGHKISFNGEQLYVFELDECETFRERPKRTKEEREARAASMTPEELKEAERQERKQSMTPFSPVEIESTFGLPVKDHVNQISLLSTDVFVPIADYRDKQEVQPNVYS